MAGSTARHISFLETGRNFVRDALANPAIAEIIVNWAEVVWTGFGCRPDRHRSMKNYIP